MHPHTRSILIRSIVSVLFLGALFSAVATAQNTTAPSAHTTPALPLNTRPLTLAAFTPTTIPPVVLPAGCVRLYDQKTAATLERSMYSRDHLTRSQQRQVRQLAQCQHSSAATRNVTALGRHLAALQRARWCSNSNVVACIRAAAVRWNVSFSLMLNRAMCESTLNPYASNGTHFGLYQFLPSTWDGTPYRNHSYNSAKWSSLAAALMQHEGQGGQWACAG